MTTTTAALDNQLEQPQVHEQHSHRPLYLKIFAGLMVLLVLTMVAALVDLDNGLKFSGANLFVAMAIAIVKAAMILLFFMHFRDSDKLTWLVGAGTVVWFGILVALTLNDYWSRGWIQSIPGK